jgi:hypothetical protein
MRADVDEYDTALLEFQGEEYSISVSKTHRMKPCKLSG